MSHIRKLDFSDWLGVAASCLCAIHCTLTPIFFAAKPIWETTMGEHVHGIWEMLDYVFLILSLMAVWYSARHTTHTTLKWVLWFAWGIFTVGLLTESFFFGKWLMYTGSIILVMAHIKNYRHCQKCKLGMLH